MSDKLFFTQAQISAVADAIRGKTGGSDLLKIGDMPGAIQGIDAGADPTALLSQILSGGNPVIEEFTYTGSDYVWHTRQSPEGSGSWVDVGLENVLHFFRVKKATLSALPTVRLACLDVGECALEELYAPAATSVSLRLFSALKKIDFSSAEVLEDAGFFSCTALKKIELPALKNFNLTGTQTPFYLDAALKRIDLGENLESLNYSSSVSYTIAIPDNTALDALILRTTGKVLEPLAALPPQFSTGGGYVYVPGPLLEGYQEQWASLGCAFKSLDEIPAWTDE